MTSTALGGTLRHLRDLFHDGTAIGLGDGTLLARYAADRDEAAFEALVARHGPMVLATCRAVLRHEHDVEDAFQATFLVLAKKARTVRAGDTLGGWLHRVAYRVSVEASVESRRRRRREAEATMRTLEVTHAGPDPDIAAIVHEELDRLPGRHRLPVVLCDLEGLSYEQAASRLRWTEPTLRHRLLKARRRLRERLTRRGITAGAVGVVLAESAAAARAAVPAALARSAVTIAAGGAASATSAALAATIMRSLFMTKLKIAVAGLLAATTLATAGVMALGAGRTDEPRPAMKMPGAAKETTAAQRIPPSDPKVKPQAPAESRPGIEGRIVDLEGRPVAKARIDVSYLWSPPSSLPGWLESLASPPGKRLGRWLDQARERGVDSPTQGLVGSAGTAIPTAFTGPDGRFRLAGVGPDQIAEILVSGPTIATAQLYVMGCDGAEVRATLHQFRRSGLVVYHARRFAYSVVPGKPIEGIVRDRDSGRPIVGLKLQGMVFEERSLVPAPGVEAWTDAGGHYRLTGLPRAPAYRLFVEPGGRKPYLNATFRVAGDTPAFEPVTYDFALKRGILLRGKVTDKATGRPVSGYVNVYTFEDNPHIDEFPGYRSSYPPHALVQDGRYEIVALPGRGVIGFRCRAYDGYGEHHYRGRVGAEAIKGYDPNHPVFRTEPAYCEVHSYNVVAELNLDPGAETAELDIQVDPGRTLVVNPVDPEGRPVTGTMAAGVSDLFPWGEHSQPSARVEVHGLDPGQPRRVTITHAGRKLIGVVYLKGDETGPLTLRLQPYGTITGRIIDDNGQPSGGLKLFSTGGVWPPPPAEQGILPGGNNGSIQTSGDGRFRIEGLVPGLKYGGSASEGGFYRGEVFRDVTVASGEVKDLGDLKPILPKRDD